MASDKAVFHIGFFREYKGEILHADKIEEYILEKFGIKCIVKCKYEGIIIVTNNFRSLNTIMEYFKYSHDVLTGHLAGSDEYKIFIKSELKSKPELKLIKG